MQLYLVEVTKTIYLKPEVIELTVKPVKPRTFKFKPGQFVFFQIGGAWKAYSMASVPEERDGVRFLVKLEPGGVGSQFIRSLKVGDRLEFSGPEGEFVVRSRVRPLHCFAAGIGVAPFLSMLPDFLSKNSGTPVTLVYGARTEGDLVHKRELELLADRNSAFAFIPVLTRPSTKWKGETGRITEYISQNVAPDRNDLYFVCGKTEAARAIEMALLEKGCKEASVISEVFLQ